MALTDLYRTRIQAWQDEQNPTQPTEPTYPTTTTSPFTPTERSGPVTPYEVGGITGEGTYESPTSAPTGGSTSPYSGSGYDLLQQYQAQNPFQYGTSSATGVVDWLKSQGVNASYVDHRGQPSADKIWIDGRMYDIIGSSDDPNSAKWSLLDVTDKHYAAQGGSPTGGSYSGYTAPSVGGGSLGSLAQFNVLDPRFNDLYSALLGRSQQSLNVNPNDPIIAGQVDSYRAEQTRGVRDYLAQQAEAQGPYSNLNSERRLANEKAAQSTGSLQASLIQNELMARRTEIQNALTQMGGMLSDQQKIALQQQLGMIDANLRQQALNSGNDQFLADLGLRAANQANYWNYQYLMG